MIQSRFDLSLFAESVLLCANSTGTFLPTQFLVMVVRRRKFSLVSWYNKEGMFVSRVCHTVSRRRDESRPDSAFYFPINPSNSYQFYEMTCIFGSVRTKETKTDESQPRQGSVTEQRQSFYSQLNAKKSSRLDCFIPVAC